MKDLLAAAWGGFKEGFLQSLAEERDRFRRRFWWMFLVSLTVGLILTLCGVRW